MYIYCSRLCEDYKFYIIKLFYAMCSTHNIFIVNFTVCLLEYYLLLADIKCGSWSALRFTVAKGEDGVPELSLLSKWLNTRGTCSDIALVTGLEVGVLASLFLFPYRDRSLLPRLWTNTIIWNYVYTNHTIRSYCVCDWNGQNYKIKVMQNKLQHRESDSICVRLLMCCTKNKTQYTLLVRLFLVVFLRTCPVVAIATSPSLSSSSPVEPSGVTKGSQQT